MVIDTMRRAIRVVGQALRRHPVVAGVAVVLVAVAAAGAIDLLRIKRDLERGSDALSGLSLDSLGEGLVPTVSQASSRLSAADDRARSSPFLRALSVVPGVDEQIDGVRDLAGVAAGLSAETLTTARAIDAQIERAGSEPAARVTLVDTALAELDRLEARMADTDVGARGSLVGPLAAARQRVEDELARIPERFDEARGYLRATRDLLEGPSRYLVLAANNAEMRGFGGMPLSGGLVTFEDGDVRFGEFKKLAYQFVGDRAYALAGLRPAPPPEWEHTYANWRMGFSWLDTAVTPNFPTVGPIYQGMARASKVFGFAEVDGVIVVDPTTLRYLLELIGPVQLDDITFTADNVEQELLNGVFFRYPHRVEREERTELEGELAQAIFEAITTRDVPIAKLAVALQDAAARRHLLAWSEDPDLQALWQTLGADGAVNRAGLVVTVQNRNGSKMDWYIDPHVDIVSRRSPDGSAWDVLLTVSIPNDVPADIAPNIWSVGQEHPTVYSTYVGIFLPEHADDIETVDRLANDLGPDPPLQLVGTHLKVRRGETKRFTITFSLPAEAPTVAVYPAARARPTTYTINGITVTDEVPLIAVLSREETDRPAPRSVALAAVLAVGGASFLLVGIRRRLTPGSPAGPRPLGAAASLSRHAPNVGLGLFALSAAILLAWAATQ